MAGYIYCMRTDRPLYRKYVKIGYTERTPEQRRRELDETWHCTFRILWDMDVYEAAKAELFLHNVLHRFRAHHEFFLIDPDTARAEAERFFDEQWRELEGKEALPPDLIELAARDESGHLVGPPDPPEPASPEDEELGRTPNHGPDSDEK
jgi:hypothetical protein